jgi:cytochrome c551
MRKLVLLSAIAVLTGLMGCSKTDPYTPPENASGEDIFYSSCTTCHKSVGDNVMVLSSGMASKEAIIEKVQKGSMRMSAFPNIQGEPAQRLAEFVLANSKVE